MPVAVVIAASNLMPGLCARLAEEGEILTFADTEPIQALQAILQRRPGLIVLERLFAATPRGAALINRIRTDPQISDAEVRVMSHTGDYVRQVSRSTLVETPAPREVASVMVGEDYAAVPLASGLAEGSQQLDWHGTRRAPRHRLRPGVEIQFDGNPVSIVDMSVVGAQVVSATILRPNQRVRVSVPTDNFVMRFRGTVAWAKFELPKPSEPPRYRAGVEFNDADSSAMDHYCARHKL
jgi:PilZ domain